MKVTDEQLTIAATNPVIVARFWSKVINSGSKECWAWKGYHDKDGYGTFSLHRFRPVRAHRLSFFIANGSWPKQNACHDCDNPGCVNPNHLIDASQKKNIQDCVKRKRHNGSRKTHCVHGHPFDDKNTCFTIRKSGRKYRTCRTCRNIARRNYGNYR